MSFKVFNDYSFRYTLVHVELDEQNGLIRRTFNNKLPCVSGQINPMDQSEEKIRKAFLNEIEWITKFQGSKFAPELISYDLDTQVIVQRYYEPSLLITRKRPTIDQVVEMYEFFKQHNVNKINGSISNMCFNNTQLIAFDYKYCVLRPAEKERELYSYNNYLVKIDSKLPKILTDILES